MRPVAPGTGAELVRGNLLRESVPGRFVLHDLLHDYAAELTHAHDPEPERTTAQRRLLDYYLHTAHAADRLLNPHRDPISPLAAGPRVRPGDVGTHEQALAWFTVEHAVLLGAVERAARAGFSTHAWQLAWAMTDFLELRAHWRDWVVTQETALTAARRLGDPVAQAHVHRDLGSAYTTLARYDDAQTHLGFAIDIFTAHGDLAGEARTQLRLGLALNARGRHRQALDHHGRALRLYRVAHHPPGQALALNNIGWTRIQLGECRQAVPCCRQALRLQQEIGSRWAEAATWDSLGLAHHELGHHRQAVDCYEHSLALYREVGERCNEATTLVHLGDARLAAGRHDLARDAWRAALAVLSDLGHPDSEEVRTRLRGRERPAPVAESVGRGPSVPVRRSHPG